jgi:hypothetical protein
MFWLETSVSVPAIHTTGGWPGRGLAFSGGTGGSAPGAGAAGGEAVLWHAAARIATAASMQPASAGPNV